MPLPPDAVARRRSRHGEPYRSNDHSGARWRDRDLSALGWRHRRHYDMRATFITLAIEDGADPDVIEARVTHSRKARNVFDFVAALDEVRFSVPLLFLILGTLGVVLTVRLSRPLSVNR